MSGVTHWKQINLNWFINVYYIGDVLSSGIYFQETKPLKGAIMQHWHYVLITHRHSVKFQRLSITLNSSHRINQSLEQLSSSSLFTIWEGLHYADIVTGLLDPFYTYLEESWLCLFLFCCHINTLLCAMYISTSTSNVMFYLPVSKNIT